MWCQESASVTVCYTCSDPILTYVLYYSFFLVFMSKKSQRVIVIFMVLNFDFWLQKLFSVLRLTVKTFWSNLHFCHVTEKLMDLWLGWKCVTKLPLREDRAIQIFSPMLTWLEQAIVHQAKKGYQRIFLTETNRYFSNSNTFTKRSWDSKWNFKDPL